MGKTVDLKYKRRFEELSLQLLRFDVFILLRIKIQFYQFSFIIT